LFLRSLDEADAKPLANTEGAGAPFFSPDGQHLAFGAGGALKRMNLRTGAEDKVTDTGPLLRSGGWNHDGVIIYGTQNTGLFRVAAAGGQSACRPGRSPASSAPFPPSPGPTR
jgi:serine/threonine-protein kinase